MEEDIDRILPELSYRSTLLWSRLNLIGQTPFLKEIQPQDDTTVAVDEQTLALIINGEQEGLIWGQRSTSHSWCSRRGVSQSPTSQDPQWRCGCPWVSDAISQDRLPPPCMGHQGASYPAIHASLSLSLSGKPITMGFCRAL